MSGPLQVKPVWPSIVACPVCGGAGLASLGDGSALYPSHPLGMPLQYALRLFFRKTKAIETQQDRAMSKIQDDPSTDLPKH